MFILLIFKAHQSPMFCTANSAGNGQLPSTNVSRWVLRMVQTWPFLSHGNIDQPLPTKVRKIHSRRDRLHTVAVVPGARVTCPWPVHDLSMTCPWPVHDLSMTCPWPVHNLSMTCPWPVHDLSMTCPWPVHDLSMTCPWPVHDLSMTCPWPVHDLSMTCPWPVHDLSMTCPWPVHDLSICGVRGHLSKTADIATWRVVVCQKTTREKRLKKGNILLCMM